MNRVYVPLSLMQANDICRVMFLLYTLQYLFKSASGNNLFQARHAVFSLYLLTSHMYKVLMQAYAGENRTEVYLFVGKQK